MADPLPTESLPSKAAEQATEGGSGPVIEWLTIAWERLQSWSSEPWFWPVVGGIVGLVIVCWVWRRYRKQRRPLQLFSNTAGRVLVGRRALSDIVRNCAQEISGDTHPRVRFQSKRGHLYVEMRVHLRGGQKLSEVSSKLQERTIALLRDSLGLHKVHVNIIAVGFSPQLPPGGTTTLRPDPVPEPSATTKTVSGTEEKAGPSAPAEPKDTTRSTDSGAKESSSSAAPVIKPLSSEERRPAPPSERKFSKPAFREPSIKEKPALSPPGKETTALRPTLPTEKS